MLHAAHTSRTPSAAFTEEEKYHIWTEHIRCILGGDGFNQEAYQLLTEDRSGDSAYEQYMLQRCAASSARTTSVADSATSRGDAGVDTYLHHNSRLDSKEIIEQRRQIFKDEQMFPYCFYTRMLLCSAQKEAGAIPLKSPSPAQHARASSSVDDERGTSRSHVSGRGEAEDKTMQNLAERLQRRVERKKAQRTKDTRSSVAYPEHRYQLYSETLPFMDAKIEAQQSELYGELCTLLLELKEGNKMRDEVRRCLERSQLLKEKYAHDLRVDDSLDEDVNIEKEEAPPAMPAEGDEEYEDDFEV